MNIFALSYNPEEAAIMHPDKIVCKMSLEMCQMLAINIGSEYLNWGEVPKKDGTPYTQVDKTKRNHPCTKWLRESYDNMAWGIRLGLKLALENKNRGGVLPATYETLMWTKEYFEEYTGESLAIANRVTSFTRAINIDSIRNDLKIDDIAAYRNFMLSKPYCLDVKKAWAKSKVPYWAKQK